MMMREIFNQPFFYYGYGAGNMHLLGLALLWPFIAIAAFWTVFWKALGLWHAARRGHTWWFIAILFLNTIGILEMIYLFAILKLPADKLFTGGAHAKPHTETPPPQNM